MYKHQLSLAAFVAITMSIVFLPHVSRAQSLTDDERSRIDATKDLAVRIRVMVAIERERMVEMRIGGGSGVVIDRRGLVLTNEHVVSERLERGEKAKHVKAQVCLSGLAYECLAATVIATDSVHDIALLQLSHAFPKAANLDAHELRTCEEVFSRAAYGVLLAPTPIIGRYAGPANAEILPVNDPRIVLDIPMAPGSSGGPVFDLAHGHLIGILQAMYGYEHTRPMSIAISATLISEFMDAHNPYAPPKAVPPKKP